MNILTIVLSTMYAIDGVGSAVGVGAFIGGVIGNYILHFKVSSSTIKKILAIAL